MADIVALCVLVAVLGAAVAYIVRQKRAGVKCIGCSVGRECMQQAKAAQASSSCGCSCEAVDRMLANIEKSLD